MNKYIIIILLFNSLSSQIIENKFINRIKYDSTSRQESVAQTNNYPVMSVRSCLIKRSKYKHYYLV